MKTFIKTLKTFSEYLRESVISVYIIKYKDIFPYCDKEKDEKLDFLGSFLNPLKEENKKKDRTSFTFVDDSIKVELNELKDEVFLSYRSHFNFNHKIIRFLNSLYL